MFERLKQAFLQTKESRSWQAILSLGYRGPQWMAGNYQTYAREGYCWNSTVYACINKTYSALSGVKYGVYRPKGDGLALVTKGPLADLIQNPNPRQSFSRLVGEWAACMELSGNAYWEGVSPDGRNAELLTRPPKELYLLRPDRMFVVPGTDPQIPILGYEYRAGAVVVPYPVQLWRNPKTGALTPRAPVAHSKYWNPLEEDGDWYGLSPVKAAARNIDAFNAAVSWNVGLTQNVARPSGVFSSDQPLTSAQAQEYTNVVRQKFSGAGNAGRPLVLGGGLKWQQLGMSPVDMDWLNGMRWNMQQICAIFGIPPQLVGDETSKTYANYEEAQRAVWNQKWLNLLDMVCGDLNTWLAPLYWEVYGEEVVIGYDRDGIEAIQEDRQIKWKNAKDGTGILTIDEQRALLGYKPLGTQKGGDTILVPSTLVPLHISAAQEAMPSLALADANAEHQQTAAQQQARLNPAGAATPGAPGQKPKPKLKPKPGKKPAKKPAKKSEIFEAEWMEEDSVPDPADLLLKQIADTRERLKLLESGN